EDIASDLVTGKNLIEVSILVPEPNAFGPEAGSKTMKGALAGILKITSADGRIKRLSTNADWQTRLASDSTWQSANGVGDLNDRRLGEVPPLPQPASLLRHTFTVAKQVKRARLYATALGSYRMFLNGRRVGNDVLTPDFTDYTKRVLYQTHDVTEWLGGGTNVLAGELGEGWFGSGLNWEGISFLFLPPPTRLIAQLEIEYSDGSHETIVSDGGWKGSESPIQRSEIYAGEVYDARLEQAGWNQANFDDSRWTTASIVEAPSIVIGSQMSAPLR